MPRDGKLLLQSLTFCESCDVGIHLARAAVPACHALVPQELTAAPLLSCAVLQELPWRRIDVSFQGARFGFAHNNIQVRRGERHYTALTIER